jgi:hypothetical protein
MMPVSQREAGGIADRGRAADAAPAPGPRRPGWPLSRQALATRGRRAAWAAGLAAASVFLFLCYLRISRTVPVNNDGASNVLQAWDMLHGNLLLHGWALSDVSFYPTELPQYMLIAAARGLRPDVVHLAAAMTYTLLVLLAGLVAKGGATGIRALARVLIAAGIMIAPQLGDASYTLLLSPDHVGTAVPLLLIWLLIDRARPRWQMPAVVAVLLTWAQVADSLALPIGAVPIAVACLARAWRRSARGDAADTPDRLVPRWYDLSLAGAALASAGAAPLVIAVIRENGGFAVSVPDAHFASSGSLPRHAMLAFRGVLELFGAGFSGQQGAIDLLFATAHLASVALAGWALVLAFRRLLRWQDLLIPALAVAIVVNLAAYVLSRTPVDILSTREIAGILPFGAVLAGRLLADRLLDSRLLDSRLPDSRLPADRQPADQMAKTGRRARLVLASAATTGLLCYLAALGYAAAQPSVPAENQDLAGWLAAHHLSGGLAGYWLADSTTLDSGQRILVVAVGSSHGRLVWGRNWEAKLPWRDSASHYANFVVTVRRPGYEAGVTQQAAQHTFGRPARTEHLGRYTVMIWDKNLLGAVG